MSDDPTRLLDDRTDALAELVRDLDRAPPMPADIQRSLRRALPSAQPRPWAWAGTGVALFAAAAGIFFLWSLTRNDAGGVVGLGPEPDAGVEEARVGLRTTIPTIAEQPDMEDRSNSGGPTAPDAPARREPRAAPGSALPADDEAPRRNRLISVLTDPPSPTSTPMPAQPPAEPTPADPPPADPLPAEASARRTAEADPALPVHVSTTALNEALAPHRAELDRCYSRHGNGRALRITIDMQIAPDGSVGEVRVTTPVAPLGTCIRDAARRWQMPASQRGARVSYPVVFRAPQAPGNSDSPY